MVKLIDTVEAQLKDARETAAPLLAALEAKEGSMGTVFLARDTKLGQRRVEEARAAAR